MMVDSVNAIVDTFSSLVKTGSREPAITGAKRKEGAFRIHEKHSSEPRDTGIYRTLIGRVDSSIRQGINGLARVCNKGKFRRPLLEPVVRAGDLMDRMGRQTAGSVHQTSV